MLATENCVQCGVELSALYPPTVCPTCGYSVRHKGFQAAWRKGYAAALGERCPYPDHRTYYHRGVTFSAAFRRMWHLGQAWAAQERQARASNPSANLEENR